MCCHQKFLRNENGSLWSFPRKRESRFFFVFCWIPALACSCPLGRNDVKIGVNVLTGQHARSFSLLRLTIERSREITQQSFTHGKVTSSIPRRPHAGFDRQAPCALGQTDDRAHDQYHDDSER